MDNFSKQNTVGRERNKYLGANRQENYRKNTMQTRIVSGNLEFQKGEVNMRLRNLPKMATILPAGCLALLLIAAPTMAQQDRDEYDSDQQSQQQRDDSQRSRDYQQDNQQDYQSDRQREFRSDTDQNQRSRRDQNQSQRMQGDQEQAGLGIILSSENGDVRVRRVIRDSAADEAGFQEDDTIVSVNGRRINDAMQLVRIIRGEDPGSQIEIQVRRDGRVRNLMADLASRREALNRGDELQRSDLRDMRQDFRQDQRQDRQQLRDTRQDDRQSRRDWRQDEQSRYTVNSPPWGDDQLLRHVNVLERQVSQLQNEIEDLRRMVQDDPSQSRFDRSRGQSGMSSRQDTSRMRSSDQRGRQQFDRQRDDRQRFDGQDYGSRSDNRRSGESRNFGDQGSRDYDDRDYGTRDYQDRDYDDRSNNRSRSGRN